MTGMRTYYELYLMGRGVSVVGPVNCGVALEAQRRSTLATFTTAVVEQLAARVRSQQAKGRRCFLDQWVGQGEITSTR